MSFEQLKVQENEEKKKKTLEQQRSEKFFEEKNVRQSSAELLQSLALQISQEFGIDLSQAKELLSNGTGSSLESLKNTLAQWEHISGVKLEEAVGSAREKLKSFSKKNREAFKQSLERDTYHPETHEFYLSAQLFSQKQLERAQNPHSLTDQVLGAWIGLIDSTEAVILFTYALGKWILLTPYHLYLMIMGKASYDGWRKI